ncbi:DNA polymerase III subunit delta [Radiobacillus sp. PE A8.2]|uniref:DNA polymerase III subunit delta n=1 Tax=Radiobacillus sp. PE A8.2 TaxID=3380349 RepID=UPI0038909C3E
MLYFDALKAIKQKKFSPIYLFYGTETFLIQELKQQILSSSLSAEDNDTNVSIYDLEETAVQEVIADAETYPFFGERKVIIAQNPSFLKARADSVSVDHQLDVLQTYLEHPVDYSILIFIAPYEKLDERKKINKLFKKQGVAVACEPIKEWELAKWINTMADEQQINIEKTVVDYMIQEVGSDLMLLQKEMEKLALFVGEQGTISMEVAEELLSHNSSTSGLKLVDAVINRDLHKAIRIYKDLEKLKEDPIALVALLASQFRTILHVKLLKQKGYTQQQMAQQLKVHPYVVKMSQTREASFTLEELKQVIVMFTETDASIKQGRMDKNLAFELLLYHLIQIKNSNVTEQGLKV